MDCYNYCYLTAALTCCCSGIGQLVSILETGCVKLLVSLQVVVYKAIFHSSSALQPTADLTHEQLTLDMPSMYMQSTLCQLCTRIFVLTSFIQIAASSIHGLIGERVSAAGKTHHLQRRVWSAMGSSWPHRQDSCTWNLMGVTRRSMQHRTHEIPVPAVLGLGCLLVTQEANMPNVPACFAQVS
jgi:hypothetical protein